MSKKKTEPVTQLDLHNPKCFANHCGLYAIESSFLVTTVRLIKQGVYKPTAKDDKEAPTVGRMDDDNDKDAREHYTVGYSVTNGLCVIELSGPSMKARSKFGGYSTIDAMRALNRAVRDPMCNSILMIIDSPGGTVSGTEELGSAVRAADMLKPVHAHMDDLGASAAYWVASQSRKITANKTASVGSIGTLVVVEDTSKKAEMEGVKVHVISTGPLKGAGSEGAPVTKEMLDYWQGLVDDTNAHFIDAVADGRKMAKKEVSKIATGQMYTAKDALKYGLIDEISSLNEAAGQMVSKYTPKESKDKRSKVHDADIRLRLEEAR